MTATATVTDLDAVRRARTEYARERRQAIAYGRWDRGLVDAGPAREHVAHLRAAGMTRGAIAAAAGVSLAAVSVLATGRPDGPAEHVRATTAAAILAVRPPERGPDPLRVALVPMLRQRGMPSRYLTESTPLVYLIRAACSPDVDDPWGADQLVDPQRRRLFATTARRLVVGPLAGMDTASRDRVIAVLVDDLGLSIRLVARIMGCSERTVRRAVQRAVAAAA